MGVQVCVEWDIEIFRIGPAWSRKAQTEAILRVDKRLPLNIGDNSVS